MSGICPLLFIGRVSYPYTKHLRNVLLCLSETEHLQAWLSGKSICAERHLNGMTVLLRLEAWIKMQAAAAAKSLQSCLTLCDPIDSSPTGSPVPGILQARTLEWVAISFSSAWKWKVKGEVTQSCPTLCHPMDCSLPGFSIHGIFQARVLEWGAIAWPKSNPLWLYSGSEK